MEFFATLEKFGGRFVVAVASIYTDVNGHCNRSGAGGADGDDNYILTLRTLLLPC